MNSTKPIPFGREMAECHKSATRLPHITEVKHDDTSAVRQLRQIILEMTSFKDDQRPAARKVEAQLLEIKGFNVYTFITCPC